MNKLSSVKKFLPLISLIITLSSFAQKVYKSGAVFNDKGAYVIDAPKDWILDNESGIDQGVKCALYLKGYNWSNSPVIMYAEIESGQTIKSFYNYALEEYLKTDPEFVSKLIRKMKIEIKYDCEIYDNYLGKYSSYERVAYIQVGGSVCYIVFSARTKSDFAKFSNSIFDVLNSFKNAPQYISGGKKLH